MDLTTFRERFDPHLRRFLLQKSRQLAAYTEDPTLVQMLAEPSRLLEAGGKRIRPLLAWLGYRLAGGKDEEAALQAVVALELFHAFALVHDDIMDLGTERHGVPTVHVAIKQQLEGREGDLAHVGVSQAIIVGDLLYSWAVEALTSAPLPTGAVQAALRVFFHMSDEVMVGQMLDIDVTTRERSNMEELRQKMLLKTAGYTFTRPLHLGIALAGGSTQLMAFAEVFGSALGVAFQIQDDILDLFGSLEQTGKTPLSDIRDRQQTLLTQWVWENGSERDRSALTQARGLRELSSGQIQEVRAAFVRSGALVHALESCRAGRARAERALTQCVCSDEDRALLQQVVEKAVPLALLERVEQEASMYASVT